MTILRGIGAFIEDQFPGLIAGVGFAGLVVIAFALFGAFDSTDCSAEVAEVEATLTEGFIASVSPVLSEMAVRIEVLERQLAQARQDGPRGGAAIRMNEQLGAYSDAAGEFYCFAVEGAGFPSG